MIKENLTQRLFWHKWPYKAIIQLKVNRFSNDSGRRITNMEMTERRREFRVLSSWTNKHLPDAGTRRETNFSIFLNTEEELNKLLDNFGDRVIATWKPANNTAMETLLAHTFDVVRPVPWYGKYSIRARIPFTNEFRTEGYKNLRASLESIEEHAWHCGGLLKDMMTLRMIPRVYSWGQPLHLYLSSNDDAAMLRLLCGNIIERFERIRPP